MKVTHILCQQHVGRFFVKHWKVQGKRIIRDNGSLEILRSRGVNVIDAKEFVYPKDVKYNKISNIDHETDAQHCLVYKDNNVLLEGIDQAKVLTNTVELDPGTLTENIFTKSNNLHQNCDKLVQSCLKSSLLFDSEQKKLPVRKDPERPAWNFPRDYGITDFRRNEVLTNRLLELCSRICGSETTVGSARFTCTVSRDSMPVNLSLRADSLVLSAKPLLPIAKKTLHGSLPDIYPLQPTISLESGPLLQDEYPFTKSSNFPYIRLAVVHFNETEVANLYETEVTESQFLGRSLMKCFTFAVAQARFLYGEDTFEPVEPVVIRCLHTDGHKFHFSIFQLNTLRESGKIQNFFWSLPPEPMFSVCNYIDAKPTLEDYNPNVFKTLLAFYQ